MSTDDRDDRRGPSIADDPHFKKRLADLDRGLGAAAREAAADSPASSVAEPPAPNSADAPPTDRPAPASTSRPVLPPLVITPEGRPLLDLFAATDDLIAKPPATASSGEREDPFALSPDPTFLYQSAEYDRVAQQMLGAIGRREPLVVLTGELGVGKSMLCAAIVEQLDRHTLVSVLTGPIESVGVLLRRLLVDFGVASAEDVTRGRLGTATDLELAEAMREFLRSLARLQNFAVVIVDDAQSLAPDVLNGLRHLVSTDERLMQIVLVGPPALAETVDDMLGGSRPPEEPVRLMLGPLAEHEVAGYVLHRLQVAGVGSRVDFDAGAIAELYLMSAGNPRLINALCQQALVAAFGQSAPVVDRTLVAEAAGQLGMLRAARLTDVSSGASPRGPGVTTVLVLLLVGALAALVVFHEEVAAILAALTR